MTSESEDHIEAAEGIIRDSVDGVDQEYGVVISDKISSLLSGYIVLMYKGESEPSSEKLPAVLVKKLRNAKRVDNKAELSVNSREVSLINRVFFTLLAQDKSMSSYIVSPNPNALLFNIHVQTMAEFVSFNGQFTTAGGTPDPEYVRFVQGKRE
ncbi:MAG TPA: hypothetical protein VG965_01835 [Patescibacteria group bacterium]|nr:hypothetical protein [Patescibacteria group bacterium]